MRFLTKDVNKELLVIIIFFLVLFIGFTVYSTSVLRGTAEEKYIYDEKLGKITAQIILEKLNQSDNLRNLALVDKAVLEHKYNELLANYNSLNEQKEDLEGEINTLKSQIEYSNMRIEGPVEQFRLIQQKNKEISDLKEALQALCLKLEESSISAEECN